MVTIEGNPWFLTADVAETLGYKEHQRGGYSHHLFNVGKDEKMAVSRATHTSDLWINNPAKRMSLLSESGLYKLVLRSNLRIAKPFQDWVTKVVLPTIRKDGAYIMESPSSG